MLQYRCGADIAPTITRDHQANMWNSFPALTKGGLWSSIPRDHMIRYLE